MAKKVTANGKTFTFDDNVTNEQIGSVVDEYFSSLKKKPSEQGLQNTSTNGQPTLNNAGLTDLNSLASGGKQPIDAEIPSVLTEQGQKPYIQGQIAKKDKALQLSQDLYKYQDAYEKAKGTPLSEAVKNIPVYESSVKQGEKEPSFISKAIDGAGYIASGLTKGVQNIAKGASYGTQNITGINPEVLKTGIDQISEPLLPSKQTEARYNDTKIVSQLHGLAEFIPASLAAEATGGATFFLNGVGSGISEVDKMKKEGVKFENGSDDAYIVGRGLIDWALMTRLNSHTIFSKLPSGIRDNVIKKLSMEAIGDIAKQGEKATGESILNTFKEKAVGFDTKIKELGINYLKSYAHTAVDLTALNGANFALGKAVNAMDGKDVFRQTEEDLLNSTKNILTIEAPIFAGFGGAKEVLSGQLFKKSPYRNEVITSLYKDATPENVDAIKSDLTTHLQEKGLNEQEIANSVNYVDKLSEVTRTLPKTLSKAKFNEGVDLIIGRQELKDQLSQIKESKQSLDESIRDIPTKEEELVQAKLEQSNDKLQELATGDKYKYSEDTEKGTYTKQLGNGKPQEISKDRYELEQLEKQFKTPSKSKPISVEDANIELQSLTNKAKGVVDENGKKISDGEALTTEENNRIGELKKIIDNSNQQSNEKTNEQNVQDGEQQNGQENGFQTQNEGVEPEGKNDGQNEVQKEVDSIRSKAKEDIDSILKDETLTDAEIDSKIAEITKQAKFDIKVARDSKLTDRPSLKVEPIEVNIEKKEDPFNKSLMNLGYSEEQINGLTTNQKQEIAINKTEAPVVESSAKVDSVKENARAEKIAEAQRKLDEEIKSEQKSNEPNISSEKPADVSKPTEEKDGKDMWKMTQSESLSKYKDETTDDSEIRNGNNTSQRMANNEIKRLPTGEKGLSIQEIESASGDPFRGIIGVVTFRNNEGKPIGYAKYSKEGITNIGVLTEEKGKGIASKMLDFLKKEKGIDTILPNFSKEGNALSHRNEVKKAIENGRYDKAIKDGTLTQEKVNEIIKSAGLETNTNEQGTTIKETKVEAQPIIKPTEGEKVSNAEDTKVVEPVNGGNKLKEDDFLEQPKDKSNEISVEEKIGLTKKDVQQLRNELGEEQYQYEVKKRSKLEQQAQKMLDDGYDLKGLVERVKNGEIPKSDVEVELIRRYYGNLTDALNKNPTAELLKEKNDFLRATDLAKTETGRLVQAWDGFTDVKDDLADFLTEESKYADLSQKEITELTDKYKKAEEARAKLQEQVDRLTAEANNKRAIEEFAKIKRKQARTNARGEVKQAEKDYRKSKIDDFRNELRKIRNQTNAIIFPYQRELIAVAPLVRDLTASYAREGINDLKIVLRGIKEELKNDIPELTEDDVRDILAGQYPNPKNTKNSKLAEIVDLQRQAKLELEIDNLQKGIVKEKSPVERKKKSDKVSELEREVKLLKQQHPELTYPEKLEDRKRFYKNQIEKIKDEIRRGEYDPLVEPQKIVLDQEALKLKDEWQNFKEETRERREKREDEARSKTDKAIDLLSQTADLLRLAQTSIDLSIPFRQGIRIMFNFNRETSAIGGRAYAEMVKSVFNTEAKGLKKLEFSEKNYHRMMFDLENNPKYLEAKDDGIIFTEIGSNNNEFRDENHRANFLYKIPYLSAPFKASERAAAAWTNYARFELYLKGTRALEAQGKTRINSKEAYESMAARVLTDTGRGKIPLLPEQSRSEGERNVKKVLGAVLYGPRLVSSVIRRLNPLYYFNPKVDITVRKEAAKDLVGYISAQVVLGLVANQLGYNVNMNPDDSDFLKWRKGKEVIDVTGGESTAARTAFRIVNAVIKQADPTVNKDDANKYSAFMQASVSNFWRNKLSPTYSYGMNFVTGKNSIGEAFNPYDILKVYPMYTDDIVKAVKEDRIMQLGYVIPIGISGLGYMQYQKDVRKAEINNYMTDKDKGLESFLKSNKISVDGNINQEIYSNETGTMMPMTEQESDKFEKHWSEEVIKGLKEKMPDIMKIKNKKLPEDKERKKIKQVISGIKTQATVNTQRFISGVAKKDLTITEGDEVRELTSTESQQMIKYINEFKKSNDYKSILDSYKEANTQLKESGKQLNIDNEMQKVTVGYAKAKLKAYMAENKIKSNNK